MQRQTKKKLFDLLNLADLPLEGDKQAEWTLHSTASSTEKMLQLATNFPESTSKSAKINDIQLISKHILSNG
jgi:hypothetical protein